MKNGLVAQVAKTSMAVDNLDLFADDDVAEDGEEGKDGGKRRFAVDDEERDVVDLETIGQVSDACAAGVCVGYDDDFVAAVYEFLAMLVSTRGRR